MKARLDYALPVLQHRAANVPPPPRIGLPPMLICARRRKRFNDLNYRTSRGFPPKVAVSNMVNSLKGGVEPPAAQRAPGHCQQVLEEHAVVAFLLCILVWGCAH